MLARLTHDVPRHPFLSLPAARQCTSLDIRYLICSPTEAAILEWVHTDAHSLEPKRIEVNAYYIHMSVANLVEQLKTVGAASKK